jgi:hypothetical protein
MITFKFQYIQSVGISLQFLSMKYLCRYFSLLNKIHLVHSMIGYFMSDHWPCSKSANRFVHILNIQTMFKVLLN